MDEVVRITQQIDVGTLIVMAAMLWFLYVRLDKRFEKIDQRFEKIDQRFEKIDQRFEKIENRLEKMQETITDMDRRLCRLEGAFQAKDCCFLKSDTNKIAE